jgi:hypothetical protein
MHQKQPPAKTAVSRFVVEGRVPVSDKRSIIALSIDFTPFLTQIFQKGYGLVKMKIVSMRFQSVKQHLYGSFFFQLHGGILYYKDNYFSL